MAEFKLWEENQVSVGLKVVNEVGNVLLIVGPFSFPGVDQRVTGAGLRFAIVDVARARSSNWYSAAQMCALLNIAKATILVEN